MVDARQCLLRDPALSIGGLDREEPMALRARTSLREASRHPAGSASASCPPPTTGACSSVWCAGRALRRALADGAAPEPEAELAGLALDLADLYWQTAAGLITGATATHDEDRDTP